MTTEATLDRLLGIKPVLESNLDYGIGIIGAGHIVNWAHLPAYRKASYKIVGIFDVIKDKAIATAEKYEVPRVYDSLDEMLDDSAVEVVDMALPPHLNLPIGKKVISKKKHMMCQKPMTRIYSEAVKLVEAAKHAGVKFAVNQNLRWSPAMWACRQVARGGVLGTPVAGFVEHSFGGEFRELGETWPPYYMQPLRYLYAKPRVVYDPPGSSTPMGNNIFEDGVHIIDSLKVLFGMPKAVMASATGTPKSPDSDSVDTIVLKYRKDFSITLRLSYNNWWGDGHLNFSFEGTDAVIRGNIGDYRRDYFREAISPNDDLEIGIRDRPVKWVKPGIRGAWIPDAFVYSMGVLLQAIKHDSEPETSGSDNLSTLRILHAALESVGSGRSAAVA